MVGYGVKMLDIVIAALRLMLLELLCYGLTNALRIQYVSYLLLNVSGSISIIHLA